LRGLLGRRYELRQAEPSVAIAVEAHLQLVEPRGHEILHRGRKLAEREEAVVVQIEARETSGAHLVDLGLRAPTVVIQIELPKSFFQSVRDAGVHDRRELDETDAAVSIAIRNREQRLRRRDVRRLEVTGPSCVLVGFCLSAARARGMSDGVGRQQQQLRSDQRSKASSHEPFHECSDVQGFRRPSLAAPSSMCTSSKLNASTRFVNSLLTLFLALATPLPDARDALS